MPFHRRLMPLADDPLSTEFGRLNVYQAVYPPMLRPVVGPMGQPQSADAFMELCEACTVASHHPRRSTEINLHEAVSKPRWVLDPNAAALRAWLVRR